MSWCERDDDVDRLSRLETSASRFAREVRDASKLEGGWQIGGSVGQLERHPAARTDYSVGELDGARVVRLAVLSWNVEFDVHRKCNAGDANFVRPRIA